MLSSCVKMQLRKTKGLAFQKICCQLAHASIQQFLSSPWRIVLQSCVDGGGSYVLLRKLLGNFRAYLGPDNPLYNLHWNRLETLFSELYLGDVLCTPLLRHIWLFFGVDIRGVRVLVADLSCLVSTSATVCLFTNYYLRLLQCVL